MKKCPKVFILLIVVCFLVSLSCLTCSAEADEFGNIPTQEVWDAVHANSSFMSGYNSFVNTYEYHLTFYSTMANNDGHASYILLLLGSHQPIKFIYNSSYYGIAMAEGESDYKVNYGYYTKKGSLYTGGSAPFSRPAHVTFNTVGYSGDDIGWGYYLGTDSDPAYTFDNHLLSDSWEYVEGTGIVFYDSFADDEPHADVTSYVGSFIGNGTPEGWYDYEFNYNSETNTAYGDFNFDVGRDRFSSFFSGGFLGQVRRWIKEPDLGIRTAPSFTLLSFDSDITSSSIRPISCEGFSLDFTDRNSFAGKILSITVPFLEIFFMLNLVFIALNNITDLNLWHEDKEDIPAATVTGI